MKKLILLSIFIIVPFTTKAQTKEETLEWLNVKKSEIRGAISNTYHGDITAVVIVITESYIKISTDDKSYKDEPPISILWSEIKDIIAIQDYIIIKTSVSYKNETKFIKLYFNLDIKKSFITALKHMATINGATLIKDDLFGN
ncbi:MAG: hypothetical protein ACOH1N_08150 [Lutibacter sp.]